MKPIHLTGLDHIVLCVADVAVTCDFYQRVLGMTVRQERPGKYSLHFGAHKISLQHPDTVPAMARDTVPGSGNFCLLTDTPIADVLTALAHEKVAIVNGPGERDGATGTILSVYFNDPDGNLVEVSNLVSER